ncbi:MAG: hypothetical protein UW97_C0030G0004 [Parcubacteria group bacterium GW2011_GWA2_45_15]|nr:MAG: hypothetical protein UW97_C0030G0004 [Parcubacteria group bacterium GW2011_GWA2_45_15]
MKKSVITILSLVAFMGGFLIFYNLKTVPSPTQNNSDVLNTPQKLESKVDDQASVTVTVTPIDILSGSKEWKFDVVMDTHSVELDQDLIKTTVLIDDQGKEYKPISWEGPVGGHHREGVLTFSQIIPPPQSVELKISGIGDVVRSFVWQFK